MSEKDDIISVGNIDPPQQENNSILNLIKPTMINA